MCALSCSDPPVPGGPVFGATGAIAAAGLFNFGAGAVGLGVCVEACPGCPVTVETAP